MMARHSELLRYGVNGLLATAVHYIVLYFCIEFFQFRSAGVANLVASAFGISVSFMGNRYFVFKNTDKGFLSQAAKFAGLYAVIGFVHGSTLYVWTDIYKLNYNFGFLIAVLIQFTLGYIASKRFVFNKKQ